MGKNKVMTNILAKSSIATKLWVWFLIVAAAPLMIVGLLTNYSSIETIKTEVSNRLNSVAENKTELINNYFKWRLADVKILAENSSVIEASEKFTGAFEKHGLKSSEYKAIDKEFRRFLTYYKEGKGYSDILFISKAGDVVFTLMHEPDFGTNLITGPYKDSELANVFSNAYTLMETEVSDFKYYPPAAEPSSFIASPVRKEGKFIGVIAFQIDTREMNKLAQDFTGLGASGEIVISAKINNGTIVLTPLRNDPNAAFKRIIPMGSELSIPSQKAIQGQKGSGIFKDYRGEEVLAVWRYLPYLRWGVVVKIDIGEAYAPIHKLTIRFLAVGIISAFVLLFISFFLSKSISKPIKRLQEGVEIIATGNLNHVVGLTTKDEIGQLSRSFDRMVVNLKNINADLTKEISERKRVEVELLGEKAFLEKLVETAPEGIAITDCQGRVLQVNNEFVRMFGYGVDEAVGKKIDDLEAPPEYLEEAGAITKSAGEGKKIVFETVRKRKDGTLFHVSIICAPIRIAEQQVAVYAIFRDITERKRAEESIRSSLAEKELLLKEVHHRVKNNLMTIIGLIKMQEMKANNEMFNPLLQELEGRIRSMALAHESLHKSEDLARIDLQNYIETLTAHIRAQFGAERDIHFSVQAVGVEVDLDFGVPCGLILNELIANACKHAFPAGKTRSGKGDCEISITMKRKGGACILTVADNGVGLPAGLNWEKSESLGLQLIKMLSQQLNGSIEVDRSAGTTFRLRFAHSSGAS
ncbi:MAG: PAS domain S-box protein [Candidatus Aminicenantes bacterium]|nr:PAS domain S-box protein [Candidatus Aminicenantes bacterium]